MLATSRSQTKVDDAAAILQSMFDYITSQTVISAAFDSDIEAVTLRSQEIQLTSSPICSSANRIAFGLGKQAVMQMSRSTLVMKIQEEQTGVR